MAQVVPVQQVGGAAHRLGGVPVLADDDHNLALRHRRPDDLLIHVIGDGLVVIVELMLLAVVDAVGIVFADPLAPARKVQLAVNELLRGRQLRIADEDQVRLVAQAGERLGEFGDAGAEAAGGGVDVRPLEAERDEDGVLRRDTAAARRHAHRRRLNGRGGRLLQRRHRGRRRGSLPARRWCAGRAVVRRRVASLPGRRAAAGYGARRDLGRRVTRPRGVAGAGSSSARFTCGGRRVAPWARRPAACWRATIRGRAACFLSCSLLASCHESTPLHPLWSGSGSIQMRVTRAR